MVFYMVPVDCWFGDCNRKRMWINWKGTRCELQDSIQQLKYKLQNEMFIWFIKEKITE